jgi:hypothetical protein
MAQFSKDYAKKIPVITPQEGLIHLQEGLIYNGCALATSKSTLVKNSIPPDPSMTTNEICMSIPVLMCP